MSVDRDALRWNGWGRTQDSFELSEARKVALVRALAGRMGVEPTAQPPAVALGAAQLPASRLSREARAALEAAVGAARVYTSDRERAQQAAGKSLPDTLRLRGGALERAPDAVVYPSSTAEVEALLAAARVEGLVLVPFGGGTSVVGGVEPLLPPG